jgi:EAL domain-containing protein (putative c-di-GMP-specific phosphodiesterase class I)/GGDEF domain-containing protein
MEFEVIFMKTDDKHNSIAPLHPRETERLQSLQSTQLLDSDPSIRFDVITQLASNVFNVPIALVSLVDSNRQWFLSRCGLSNKETHRDDAFCAHAILEEELLVVEDARAHPIFKHNALVVGEPRIQFYAGAVIRDANNLPLGTLCILDQSPRKFSEQERCSLIAMAKLVRHEIIQPEELSMQRIRSKLQSNKDPLTNALWGKAFFEEINRRISSRTSHSQYYMLCLEFTNIDSIENHYGGIVADEVILEISARLRNCVSKIGTSILGRMDNKEFGVLIGLDHGLDHAAMLIETVSTQLRECLTGSVKTSASEIEPYINLTIIHDDFAVSAPNEIFRMAQICVKEIPQYTGINTAIVTDDIRRDATMRSELTREFSQSIEQDLLHMVYQPKIDAVTEKIVGLEALLRWNHPKYGFIYPATIIKIATESNLIYKLEKWIFKTVIAQAKYWKEQGIALPSVSINATADTLLQKGFVNFVTEQISQANLSGENFDIEIVESSMFEDFDAVVSIMNQLREFGLSFSLDDFGTGFSNLAYLKELPITHLKIDKSFVDGISHDRYASAMCAGIISLARILGVKIVAEGVESESQAVALRALHCNVIQGFYYSKPVSAKEIEMKYYRCVPSKTKINWDQSNFELLGAVSS